MVLLGTGQVEDVGDLLVIRPRLVGHDLAVLVLSRTFAPLLQQPASVLGCTLCQLRRNEPQLAIRVPPRSHLLRLVLLVIRDVEVDPVAFFLLVHWIFLSLQF